MNRTRQFAVLVGLLLLGPAWSSAQEVLRTKASNVIERFSVSRDGDALLLPVKLNGKTYQFILDTGATATLFDSSLPLGKPTRRETMSTAVGKIDILLFGAPDANLGEWNLRNLGEVTARDLGKSREISGHDIFGTIGMDLLGKHVIQIDSDQGEVRFLHNVGPEAGTPIRLIFQNGCPFADFKLDDGEALRFLIDTGIISRDSGDLHPGQLSKLIKTGRFHSVGSSLLESAGGQGSSIEARGKQISIGDITVANPVFGTASLNVISMHFLSRFIVTFDFPNRVMYLQKGKRFASPDLWDLSGLHLLRRNGATEVHSADKGSAAATRGIVAGDKIAKVGDKSATEFSMFELRRLLSQPGTVDLVIERDGRHYSAKLSLKQ